MCCACVLLHIPASSGHTTTEIFGSGRRACALKLMAALSLLAESRLDLPHSSSHLLPACQLTHCALSLRPQPAMIPIGSENPARWQHFRSWLYRGAKSNIRTCFGCAKLPRLIRSLTTQTHTQYRGRKLGIFATFAAGIIHPLRTGTSNNLADRLQVHPRSKWPFLGGPCSKTSYRSRCHPKFALWKRPCAKVFLGDVACQHSSVKQHKKNFRKARVVAPLTAPQKPFPPLHVRQDRKCSDNQISRVSYECRVLCVF